MLAAALSKAKQNPNKKNNSKSATAIAAGNGKGRNLNKGNIGKGAAGGAMSARNNNAKKQRAGKKEDASKDKDQLDEEMEKYWLESGNEAMKAKAEESRKSRLEAKKMQEKLALDNQLDTYWSSKPAEEGGKESSADGAAAEATKSA